MSKGFMAGVSSACVVINITNAIFAGFMGMWWLVALAVFVGLLCALVTLTTLGILD